MKLMALALLLFAAPEAEPPPNANPRTELNTAIPYALQLVKQEKYEQFINEFAPPDELQKVLAARKIDDLVRSFSKEKATQIVAVLTSLQDAQPRLDESGTVAEYVVSVPNFPKKKVVFEKIGDHWYIRN